MSTTDAGRILAHRRRTCIFFIGCLLCSPLWADEWVMPGLDSQWIAREMELNGVPASMRTLSGSLPMTQVLDYYRKKWGDTVLERREGNWRILATRHRDRFISLRLRNSGRGIRGVLTVSLDPAVASPSLASSLPTPPGLSRLSHQAFTDSGSRGENLTLMSLRSVGYERQAFESIYRLEGFKLVEDRATQLVQDGHIMQFLRGKQQVRVVLYRDPALANGRTLILVSAHHD